MLLNMLAAAARKDCTDRRSVRFSASEGQDRVAGRRADEGSHTAIANMLGGDVLVRGPGGHSGQPVHHQALAGLTKGYAGLNGLRPWGAAYQRASSSTSVVFPCEELGPDVLFCSVFAERENGPHFALARAE